MQSKQQSSKIDIKSKGKFESKPQKGTISSLNRSLDNLNNYNRSFNSSKSKNKEPLHDFNSKLSKFTQKKGQNKNKPVAPMDRDQIDPQEINKLTQLFSQQLNSE